MDTTTLLQITHNFTKELKNAALGKQTSLAYIKNTIPSSSLGEDTGLYGGFALLKSSVKHL